MEKEIVFQELTDEQLDQVNGGLLDSVLSPVTGLLGGIDPQANVSTGLVTNIVTPIASVGLGLGVDTNIGI